MFTGLVQRLGRVSRFRHSQGGAQMCIDCVEIAEQLNVGDSVAVNGCCLTATSISGCSWTMDLVPETLARTSLGSINEGDEVNLELALRASDRLGGHFVQGHVDGIGHIAEKSPLADGSTLVAVHASPALLRYVIEKGSITVDGVSLTVAYVDESKFQFAMIPHTAKMTTLGGKVPSDPVNLEVDLLAKYVEKLTANQGTPCLTIPIPSSE